MFEHKHLDGKTHRIIDASDAFISKEILESREGLKGEPETLSRKQFGVVGDLLVERCLPPETMGDTWSHDSVAAPWWTKVMNPPHMGIVAEFNLYSGGLHRKHLESEHNVAAYAAAGEEVLFKVDEQYHVTRQSDGQELSAPSLLELRKLYYS